MPDLLHQHLVPIMVSILMNYCLVKLLHIHVMMDTPSLDMIIWFVKMMEHGMMLFLPVNVGLPLTLIINNFIYCFHFNKSLHLGKYMRVTLAFNHTDTCLHFILVTCAIPEKPANGFCSGGCNRYFFPGVLLKFMCLSGYMLNGSATIVCQDDRTWNAPAPTCVEASGRSKFNY